METVVVERYRPGMALERPDMVVEGPTTEHCQRFSYPSIRDESFSHFGDQQLDD